MQIPRKDPPTPGEQRNRHYGRKYIPWGGRANDFPEQMEDLLQASATLKAVLNSQSRAVAGGGFSTESEEFAARLARVNADQSVNDFAFRVELDLNLYGQACFLEIRERAAGVETVRLKHQSTGQVRYASFDTDDPTSEPTEILVANWARGAYAEKTRYSLVDYTESTVGGRRVRVKAHILKDYEPGSRHYGFPNWMGAWYDCWLEQSISRLNYNVLEQGSHLAGILSWDLGQGMTEKGAELNIEQLKANLKGTGNAGKVIVLPSLGASSAPSFVQFDLPDDGSFVTMYERVQGKIVTACNWYRSLAGLATPGQLGNTQQIRQEWQLALDTFIKPHQKRLQDAIMRAYQGTRYENETFSFTVSSPVNAINELGASEFAQVLRFNEVRRELGMTPDEDMEDTYLKPTTDAAANA